MPHFKQPTWPEWAGVRGHLHRSANSRSGGDQRHGAPKNPGKAKEVLFRVQDWEGVVQLLADAKADDSGPATIDGDELASALAELRASLVSPILRVGQIAEQLTDVWALAANVDPAAARPAEALLWATEGCDLVTAGQVRASCDQVEAVLRSRAVSAPA
jgi:hypothetical protein